MAINSLFFSLDDIQEEWRQKKKRWAQVTLFAILLPTALFFLTPVQFVSQATFKEEIEKEDQMSNLKDLLGAVSAYEPKASVLMKSKRLLRPVVENLGLQVRVDEKSLLSKVMGRLLDNWALLIGGEIKDRDAFLFRDVKYEGEKISRLELQILSDESFAIYAGKKELGKGKLFEPFHFKGGQFTLYHIPERVRKKKKYSLLFTPWLPLFEGLSKSLVIESDKINKSILRISFSHRDRWQATALVNEVMQQFKNYLSQEQEERTKAQIAYLERRQEKFKEKWQKSLEEHVAFVEENIAEDGFLGYQERLAHFLHPLNSYMDKLLSLELEDLQLEEGECAGSSPIFPDMKGISDNKEMLTFRKNLIANSLPEKEKMLESLLTLFQKLEREEEALSSADSPVTKEKNELISQKQMWEKISYPSLPNVEQKMDLFERLQEEKKQIEQVKIAIAENDREALSLLSYSTPFQRDELFEHVEEYEKLVELKEKTYKERILSSLSIPEELEGIELETANLLVGEYQSGLDKSFAFRNKLQLLRAQLARVPFDAGSLLESIKDPISQKLLGKISDLQQALHDKKNHSEREQNRIGQDIESTREFLLTHLEKLEQIEKLNQDFLQKNISRIQEVIIDRINQKLGALSQQEERFIHSRKKQIATEKNLLLEKIAQIKQEMQFLPKQWFKETMLKWQTELSMRMMESITKILESKTISSHLHNISSKPLDHAEQPLKPISKKLGLKILFMLLLSHIGFVLFLIIKMHWKGFTPSLPTLQGLGQSVVGPITKQIRFAPFVGEDIETLRSSLSFVTQGKGKKVAIYCKENENFTPALAELLGKMGFSSLILSLSFSHVKEKKGWLQYIKQEVKELPIQEKEGFYFLPTGGITSFGFEQISSPPFASLIEEMEKEYDFLFLHHDGTLDSMQGKALLHLVEKALVCYEKERIEALQPYMDWGYIDDKRIAFMKVVP